MGISGRVDHLRALAHQDIDVVLEVLRAVERLKAVGNQVFAQGLAGEEILVRGDTVAREAVRAVL